MQSAIYRFEFDEPVCMTDVETTLHLAILGAEGVGQHAGEWVQFISMAMQNGLSIADVARTMFIYPTFAELAKKPITRYLRAKEPSDWFKHAQASRESADT